MKVNEAIKITEGFTRTSKMPGLSYSLPAWACKTGQKLAKIPGTPCYGCYAMKGNYTRYPAIKHPLWVGAMAHLINSKKANVFRWHDSGDVQDEEHLIKIFAVCKLTPKIRHWLPTREAWIKAFLPECPENLVIRFSAPMIDQEAPASWPNSSEVVTAGATCPAAQQDNECRDCRACWDATIKTIKYGKH